MSTSVSRYPLGIELNVNTTCCGAKHILGKIAPDVKQRRNAADSELRKAF